MRTGGERRGFCSLRLTSRSRSGRRIRPEQWEPVAPEWGIRRVTVRPERSYADQRGDEVARSDRAGDAGDVDQQIASIGERVEPCIRLIAR